MVKHTLSCIEHGGVLDPFTCLTFHICKKFFADSLGDLNKNKSVNMLHIVGRAALVDGIDLDFILLDFSWVCRDVVLECFKSKVFDFSLFSLVIEHKLWLDYTQQLIEKDDTTCYAIISNFVSVPELIFVGMKGGVSGSFHMVFETEVDGASKFSNLIIVLVEKAEVPRYICIDGRNFRVHGCGERGKFVSHKSSSEGVHLVEGQPNELSPEIFIIAEVCIPAFDARYCLC